MAFEALKQLQEKCGVAPDGAFGPNTARAIVTHYELSPERGAHLLGQVVHESGSFKYTRENLNYSVEAIMKVWPSRFPTKRAQNHLPETLKHWLKTYILTAWGTIPKKKPAPT